MYKTFKGYSCCFYFLKYENFRECPVGNVIPIPQKRSNVQPNALLEDDLNGRELSDT